MQIVWHEAGRNLKFEAKYCEKERIDLKETEL